MRVALLLMLVACGDNLPGPLTGETHSGDRLKLNWFEFDGVRQLASPNEMQDVGRGENCLLQRWSDGRTYCTPAAVIGVYTDDACTHEVGRIRNGDVTPRYVQHFFFFEGDFLPSRLYEMGSEAAAPAKAYKLMGSSCAETTLDAHDRFVELGDEIPKEALVSVGRKELPSDGTIGLVIDHGSDGTVIQVGAVDRALGTDCSIDGGADAETVACAPTVGQFTADYLDADCTAPAFAASSGVELPDLVKLETPVGCFDVRRLGELTTKRSVFAKVGDVCTETPVSETTRVFELGDQIEIQRLDRVRGDGERFEAVADGEIGFIDPFIHDSTLDVDCRATRVGNDVYCIPVIAAVEQRFADPACTELVAVALVPADACTSTPRFARFQITGPRAGLYPIVGPSPVLYEITTGDRCAQALIPPGVTFGALGLELPLDTFARAALVTE